MKRTTAPRTFRRPLRPAGRTRRRRAAFTLVEAIVVVAGILILALLFFPTVITCGPPDPYSQVRNSGRNIYVSIFSGSLENPLTPVSAWPHAKGPLDTRDAVRSFPDSTSYFTWLVTNGVMKVDFNFFGAQGTKFARSDKPSEFTAAHNAWAVAVGKDLLNSPDDVPVLFTANISQDRKVWTPLDSVDQQPFLPRRAQPLDGKRAILIHNGGASQIIKRSALCATNFNPVGATNLCLYP